MLLPGAPPSRESMLILHGRMMHLRHNLHSAQTLSAAAWQGDRRDY